MSAPKRIFSRSRDALQAFLEIEASGGIALLVATVVALIWSNVLPGYESFWDANLTVGPVTHDLRHWTNDGLMAIFFFVVGLEIKRELVLGELRDMRVAALPLVAAIGGMAGPALIYLAINAGADTAAGWAIPMATDIAFVVGILALLGPRVPQGLKVFLLTLAIADDVGAIVVIALVFPTRFEPMWLLAAACVVAVVVVLRAARVAPPWVYVLPAVALWLCMLEGGLHPTLAGVALGLLTPARNVRGRSVLEDLERRLHPLSSYVIVPIFALANAGVVLTVATLHDAFDSRLFWGIVIGLLVGKTVGIFGISSLFDALPGARRPASVGWGHLLGGAMLAGIGFTVSLFIANLAFDAPRVIDIAKIGVLAGSVLSATLGALTLAAIGRRVGTGGR